MLRILARDGKVILQEPIRFSCTYGHLRNLLPDRDDISGTEYVIFGFLFFRCYRGHLVVRSHPYGRSTDGAFSTFRQLRAMQRA